jgi:uncharacterized protein YbjQ (UPF0145 family)
MMNLTKLTNDEQTGFINKFLELDKEGYCTNCFMGLVNEVYIQTDNKKKELVKEMMDTIPFVPIITGPAPHKWDYQIIGIITTQITAGTGFATELSRSFADLFGSTSNASNKKVSQATETCKADLRLQCIKEGGNAIISTDIDFSEIGSGSSNMLMVCMAGTAIKVNDLSYFPEKSRDSIGRLSSLNAEMEDLQRQVENEFKFSITQRFN